jgi:iron-sulfur cluster repair protein YtfE (RIC family)
MPNTNLDFLPVLEFLTDKVARKHGQEEPRWLEVRKVYLATVADLERDRLEEARQGVGRLKELTDGFTVSEDACPGRKALMTAFAGLEMSLNEGGVVQQLPQ